MRRRIAWCRVLRACGVTLAILIAILYFLNMPFYSGSSIGAGWSWRMEHGRIRLQHSPHAARESFYVAINNEGLRFRPDWQFHSVRDWYVTIPLWLPLGALGAVTAASWITLSRSRCHLQQSNASPT